MSLSIDSMTVKVKKRAEFYSRQMGETRNDANDMLKEKKVF
jgi:hypothetical protein